MTYKFESERLSFRFFELSDCDRLVFLLNDKEMTQYVPIPFPYTKEMAKSWVSGQKETRDLGLNYDFAIVLKETKQLIGSVSVSFIDKDNKHGELGCWIAKDFWHKGYMTESLKRVIRFAFEELKLHKVYAKHYVENIASGKGIQKSGLTFVGILKDHVLKDGVYHDNALYEIMNEN
ncbi:MAG: GNAT family N-acetyltransferase [Clostridia bacterium]|nr:GNAT family N-acetyltransferase [Clostridia bacterium]